MTPAPRQKSCKLRHAGYSRAVILNKVRLCKINTQRYGHETAPFYVAKSWGKFHEAIPFYVARIGVNFMKLQHFPIDPNLAFESGAPILQKSIPWISWAPRGDDLLGSILAYFGGPKGAAIL